jgi:hypothetical protein
MIEVKDLVSKLCYYAGYLHTHLLVLHTVDQQLAYFYAPLVSSSPAALVVAMSHDKGVHMRRSWNRSEAHICRVGADAARERPA